MQPLPPQPRERNEEIREFEDLIPPLNPDTEERLVRAIIASCILLGVLSVLFFIGVFLQAFHIIQ